MDYGMKEKNPIDHVRFYMKGNPTIPIQVRSDQVMNFKQKNMFISEHIFNFGLENVETLKF